jgi:hypothetical protein
MKASCNTAPVRISPTHQRGLEITQHQKMLKMKVAPKDLLKIKELHQQLGQRQDVVER